MHVEFCNIMLNSATDVDMSFFSITWCLHIGVQNGAQGQKAGSDGAF